MATAREIVLAQPFPLTRGETLDRAWSGYWVAAGYAPGSAIGVDDASVQQLAAAGVIEIIGDRAHKRNTERLI